MILSGFVPAQAAGQATESAGDRFAYRCVVLENELTRVICHKTSQGGEG